MDRRGLLKLLGIAPVAGFAASESKTPVKTAIVEEGLTQPSINPVGSSECISGYAYCISTASGDKGSVIEYDGTRWRMVVKRGS